jgi:hypothetical protein
MKHRVAAVALLTAIICCGGSGVAFARKPRLWMTQTVIKPPPWHTERLPVGRTGIAAFGVSTCAHEGEATVLADGRPTDSLAFTPTLTECEYGLLLFGHISNVTITSAATLTVTAKPAMYLELPEGCVYAIHKLTGKIRLGVNLGTVTEGELPLSSKSLGVGCASTYRIGWFFGVASPERTQWHTEVE